MTSTERVEGSTRLSIPLSVALPILTLAVSSVLFVYDIRADLEHSTRDRITGSDVDRFIERLQVSLDRHCSESGMPMLKVHTWRAKR